MVDDIYQWMRHYGVSASSPSAVPDKITPSSNVNVKEAVTVFNQIAAQREKYVLELMDSRLAGVCRLSHVHHLLTQKGRFDG